MESVVTKTLAEQTLQSEYINEKGGGQHITLQTLGRNGSLKRLPAAFVGQYFGHPTGIATIIKMKDKFPGYFTNQKTVKSGAAVEPPAEGRDNEWPGGAPGIGKIGSLTMALDTVIQRNSRRGTATASLGVQPIFKKSKKDKKKLIYSYLTQGTRKLSNVVARPYPGIVVPTLPNPTGKQIFKGAWKGLTKAPLPYV